MKASPEMKSAGMRLDIATPAAVTMFVAPGPIELVATMTCRRRVALPNATAARPIPSSVWPRQTGISSRCCSRAWPRLVTFPWPKIANTPGNSGTSRPSTSVRWAMR